MPYSVPKRPNSYQPTPEEKNEPNLLHVIAFELQSVEKLHCLVPRAKLRKGLRLMEA